MPSEENKKTAAEPAQNPAPRGRAFDLDIDVATAGERRKIILGLTWPALAENVLASLVNMVDTIMVASLGTAAISGINLAVQPRFIMLSVFMAMNVGCTALAARFKGAGDREGANNVLRQSLMLSAFLCLIIVGVMLIVNQPLIRYIAGPQIAEESIQNGINYFFIQMIGFPLTALTFAINAVLRGVGNTRAAFYNNSVANLVNVVLNYLLIYKARTISVFGLAIPMWGAGLGVVGASLATIIGQGVALMMGLSVVLGGSQYVHLSFRVKWKPDFSLIGRIMRIGLPAMVEQLFMRVGMMMYTTTVTRLGDNSYAAHVIANNIQQLSFTTGMAFGTAATTLTGQSLGKKKPELARTYNRDICWMAMFVSILIGVALLTFGRALAHLYTQDEIVIGLAVQALTIVAFAQPFQSARFVFTSALRGAGDSRFTAVITLIGILIVRPLVSKLTVDVLSLGLIGAWIALISDQMTCFVLAIIRYVRGKWATLKV